MELIETNLPDIKLIQPKLFGDDRGFFLESYNRKTLDSLGVAVGYDFVQDNHSRSVKNVLRGLHYQIQNPQGKLVRVTAGAVYDVAVDLREGSPTFGQWAGFELSAANQRMAWIPPGFAHGFLVLSDSADFQYKTTDYYAPAYERSLLWNDAQLGIEWPLDGAAPILSAKDAVGIPLETCDTYKDAFELNVAKSA